MPLDARNASLGFAARTRINLDHIERASARGDAVHDVTQIVNSLLGLIVFPWEDQVDRRVKEQLLDALEKKGWPHWNVTLGKENCRTLGGSDSCVTELLTEASNFHRIAGLRKGS
jgi:hypothetical protein